MVILQRLLALIALCSVTSQAAAIDARPNIVIILADDLGWSDLVCYGNRFNESPNLDRLASEGIRFTQFYAGPVCSPTRANLQSGQDQARFGITQHIPGHRRPFAKLIDPVVASQLPLEVETFAESLAAAGYATGYFGKWHLGGEGFGPSDQGWSTTIELRGHTVSPSNRDQKPPQRTAEFLVDQAIEFISLNQDRPFLLQISHFAVHIPLSVTQQHRERFLAKLPVDGYPSRPDYAALLLELDDSVARVVNEIDRLGLAEETLVLFVSDNGGLEHEQDGTVVTSNAPLKGEKGSLYEGGIRVPAIARWPGVVPAATTCDHVLSTVDVHATIREIANAKLINEEQPSDGISFADVLRDPTQVMPERELFWHLPHYHHSTPSGAVRNGDWKLIEFFEDGAVELYNMHNDRSEQNDVAAANPEIVAHLKPRLKLWQQKVGAKMPVPNPAHDARRASQLGKTELRRDDR